MQVSSKIRELHLILYEGYGPQGWWPLVSKSKCKRFDSRGYHRLVYDYPKTKEQRFEVVVGAILTQNTAWKNAEKALGIIHSGRLVFPEKIVKIDEKRLASKLRSAGYYNQKAKKLKGISEWFLENDKKVLNSGDSEREVWRARNALLAVNGVGPETADSILLYAYHKPIFVVDAYTKRIFHGLGFYDPKKSKKSCEYALLQGMVHKAFKKDRNRARTFNEFHALIVERGKTESMFRKRKGPPNRSK